jgi:PAS domain S-box-containing protein
MKQSNLHASNNDSPNHLSNQETLENRTQIIPDCISKYSLETQELELNSCFTTQFGLQILSPRQNKKHFEDHIHPEDRHRVTKELELAIQNNETDYLIRKFRLLKSDGQYAKVEEKLILIKDKQQKIIQVLGLVTDISYKQFQEKLEALSQNVLKLNMETEVSLETILSNYLLGLEQMFPEVKTSVFWVRNECIYNLVSPSLDAGYVQAIEGQKIGLNRGSCGTAAFLKERVIVSNVFKDEKWKEFKSLAKQFNFSACWSQPIFNRNGEVIATFAMYYKECTDPNTFHLQAIDKSKNLLSLILSNHLYVQNIIENNIRYDYVNKVTKDAIYDWNLNSNRVIGSESFTRVLGYPSDSSNENHNPIWDKIILSSDFIVYQKLFAKFLNNKNRVKWETEYRVKRYNGSTAYIKEIGYLIRDTFGNGQRLIGVLRDVSEEIYSSQITVLQHELSEFFKAKKLLKPILDLVLPKLAEFGSFKTAEIWLNSVDETNINLVSKYTSESNYLDYFKLGKDHKIFLKGESIPGLVWETKHPVLFNDIQTNPNFHRRELAKSVGLKAAYGIPLTHKQEIVGVLMFCRDEEISENQQELNVIKRLGDFLGAEIKRKQQEEEMWLLFESAPEMMAIVSPNGYFVKVNPTFCKVLGYSQEEIIYRPFSDFLDPEDLNKTMDEYQVTISGERNADNFINKYVTKSGDKKWISWSSSDVFGEDGFVFAFGRDITEIKELENLMVMASKFSKVGGWELSFLKPEKDSLTWSNITQQIFEVDAHYKPEYPMVLSFFKEESKQMLLDAIESLRENAVPFDLKLLIETAKGNERWIRIIGNPSIYEGRIQKIFGSIQDIHDQKLLENELQILLSEKTEILESIGDGFYRVDSNWTITYWNRQAENFLKIPREQTLGKNIWDIFPVGKESGFYKNLHLAVAEKRKIHFEGYYEVSKQWLEASVYPSNDGLSIYFKDITQRIQALEKIQQSNERFEKVTEATNDAIWDWDLESGSLYYGKGFETLFGFNPIKLEPNVYSWENFLHPEDKDKVKVLIEEALKNPDKNIIHMEYRYLKQNGAYAFISDRCIIIRNSIGKPIRMLGAMSDITSHIEYQKSLLDLNQRLANHAKELSLSNKELEQFAYVASHDLQEPLRMVSSFLTLLEKKYQNSLDEKAHQYIHFAVDGAKRMRQIILDLLEFSRVGKNEGEEEVISLNHLIDEVLALHRKTIAEKKANFQIEVLPNINAIRAPLLQVFHNLIGNALKYSKDQEAPLIQIWAKQTEGAIEVAIQDNGIGIEEEYFEKIFIIFQRLQSAEKYGGTGMGLSIVKKIMENLGGSVKVESTPNAGSIFYLNFPHNKSLSN